jgi:hypothetical protein
MSFKTLGIEILSDGTDVSDVFVVVDGVRIAKRGHPDTRHAMTWISLEPGFVVTSPPDYDTITIEYHHPGAAQ